MKESILGHGEAHAEDKTKEQTQPGAKVIGFSESLFFFLSGGRKVKMRRYYYPFWTVLGTELECGLADRPALLSCLSAQQPLLQTEIQPCEPRTPATKKQEIESVMPEISLCAQPCPRPEISPGAEALIAALPDWQEREQGMPVEAKDQFSTVPAHAVLLCRPEFQPAIITFSTSPPPIQVT